MAKMTQCDRILRHMKDYGSIDPMEAIRDYGCMRLSARISDLKDRGYKIVPSVQGVGTDTESRPATALIGWPKRR